jgi:hypothetical protein
MILASCSEVCLIVRSYSAEDETRTLERTAHYRQEIQ